MQKNHKSFKGAALLLALLFALLLLAACGGPKDDEAGESDTATGESADTVTTDFPVETPATEEEAEQMLEVADAIDSGDFPYTVDLGPGWSVKASMGGAVIVEKENGLVLSMQLSPLGESGITVDKLEESAQNADPDAIDLSNGKVGIYDAVMMKTTSISDEAMPPSRVAYVIVENDQVVAISIGGKAGDDPASVSFTDTDIDAAFALICESFHVK